MTFAPHVWPETAAIIAGRLFIGGCDTVALAERFGTPLYLLDEATLRGAMRRYRTAFAAAYPGPTRIHYAGKALLRRWLKLCPRKGWGWMSCRQPNYWWPNEPACHWSMFTCTAMQRVISN